MTCISTISKKFVAVDFIVFDHISACGRTSIFMTCTCIPKSEIYIIYSIYTCVETPDYEEDIKMEFLKDDMSLSRGVRC